MIYAEIKTGNTPDTCYLKFSGVIIPLLEKKEVVKLVGAREKDWIVDPEIIRCVQGCYDVIIREDCLKILCDLCFIPVSETFFYKP